MGQSEIAHFQKLPNQSMVNGALVIEMAIILLVKARKTLVVWWSEEHSNQLVKLFRGAKEGESW